MINTSPNQIYGFIQDEVGKLLFSLSAETTDADIKSAQQKAQKQLEGLHQVIDKEIISLESNAEWDVFCIAFYGETNAGKSTLIETLRILLDEPRKKQERELYAQSYTELSRLEQELQAQEIVLADIKNDYQLEIQRNTNEIEKLGIEIRTLEQELPTLQETVITLKEQISILRKKSIVNFIKALFRKLDAQKESRDFENKTMEIQGKITGLVAKKKDKEDLFFQIKTGCNERIKNQIALQDTIETRIDKRRNELVAYSDGKIIGDGHSDFTREVVSYQFEKNGQKFALLDLPGIEGKESLVRSVISAAVEKAHAVFYVSSKPTPPQTGDEGAEGTLEKITKHLGRQSEVHSIFNKRIKNPQQLKPGLVDEDEKQSLHVFDGIMKESLGEQYGENHVLSAYPAFLSVANCWENDFAKGKRKFLDGCQSYDKLLQDCLVKCFCDWLVTELVSNCKQKIIRSNYKKVSAVIIQAKDEVRTVYTQMRELYDKLQKNRKATDRQLDVLVESVNRDFKSELSKALNNFKASFRKRIYADIDKGIGNDEFKAVFERRKEEAVENLSTLIHGSFDIVLKDFTGDITVVIDKYQRYANELLALFEKSADFTLSFSSDIKIKSGMNVAVTIVSLLSGVAGFIICLSNPAGWVVIILSAIGLAISLVKAVVGFFNHDYRAAQQKMAANDNIDKISEIIKDSVQNNLDEANGKICESIESLKKEIQKSLEELNVINSTFETTGKKLERLARNIDIEGAL